MTPEEELAALEGVPVTLLPVRLETRFAGPPEAPTELRIRVYPDQVHIDAHEPSLTDGEIASSQAYWRNRLGEPGPARAWEQLTRGVRPARAAWIVRSLTPAAGGEGEPEFPTVARRDAAIDLPMKARALPTRWIAVGFDAKGTQILRRWFDNPIPDELPTAAALAGGPPLEGDAAVDAYLGWASDYKQAVAAGMALTVRPADLAAGRSLAAGFARLVVLGVDSSADAAASATELEALLAAHAVSDGLGYLATGTPTNNMAEEPAAGGPVGVSDPAANMPAGDPDWSAAARVTGALGLPADSPLAGVPGAASQSARVSAAIVDATWAASLGYFADQLMAPLIGSADLADLRSHTTRFLQPLGPLPTLRIGRQPLGLVPVLAPGRPPPNDPFATKLADVLGKLRPIWDRAGGRVPTLARQAPGQPLERALLTILQRGPWTTRVWYRRVFGPLVGASAGGLGGAQSFQSVLRNIGFLDGLGAAVQPRLVPFGLHDRRGHLPVPFVNRGELKQIFTMTTSPRGRAELGDASDARSLLGALATFAALQELDLAGARLARRFLPQPDDDVTAWRTPEISGVGKGAGPSLLTLASTPLAGLGGRTPAAEVAERQRTSPTHRGLTDLAAFQSALKRLAASNQGDVERALRAYLGACSHRLDAWHTSLASRQLAAVRSVRPQGVHVGGYGYVEGLRPETAPDSFGYVVAPSLAHAATAGVLRSGYLAHFSSRFESLDVDLSSARTQTALELMRGVRAGLPLGVLLGYRLERALREQGLSLMILPLRKAFPVRRTVATTGAELPVESTPPGDVVEAAELLERWESGSGRGRLAVLSAVRRATRLPASPTLDANLTRLGKQIDLLAETYDAIADTALAESVHQIVRGQPERARAAMGFLDRQEVPVEPDVTASPRPATAYVQRLVVALGAPDLSAAWQPVSSTDPRAKAEPRVNAWIARLLGDPARWRFSAQTVAGDGTPAAIAAVGLIELGLSPLALVVAANTGAGDRPSELEERIGRLLATRLPAAGGLELLAETPGARGLAAFAALASAIGRVLRGARPADASVFDRPDTPPAVGFDANDLRRRADAAVAELRGASTALDAALVAPAKLPAALERVSRAGVPGAVPPLGLAGDQLLDFARAVAALAQARLRQADDLGVAPAAPDAAAHHQRRLEAVFAGAFPVLGVLALGAGAGAARSVASARQAAMLGDDPLAPVTWMMRLARVRPDVDALWHLLTVAEVTTGYDASRFAVAQLPQRDGDRWAGLSFEGLPASARPTAEAAVVVHASGTVTLAAPFAALAIDSWTEQIPLPVETAGVSLHYDAPSNRAPQAAVIAVPRDLSERPWGLDVLVATVVEALDLARIRGVQLHELPAAGAVLPALYVPVDATGGVPSFDVHRLASRLGPDRLSFGRD